VSEKRLSLIRVKRAECFKRQQFFVLLVVH